MFLAITIRFANVRNNQSCIRKKSLSTRFKYVSFFGSIGVVHKCPVYRPQTLLYTVFRRWTHLWCSCTGPTGTTWGPRDRVSCSWSSRRGRGGCSCAVRNSAHRERPERHSSSQYSRSSPWHTCSGSFDRNGHGERRPLHQQPNIEPGSIWTGRRSHRQRLQHCKRQTLVLLHCADRMLVEYAYRLTETFKRLLGWLLVETRSINKNRKLFWSSHNKNDYIDTGQMFRICTLLFFIQHLGILSVILFREDVYSVLSIHANSLENYFLLYT